MRAPGSEWHGRFERPGPASARPGIGAVQRIVTPDLAGSTQPAPDWRDLGWSDLPAPPQNERSGFSQCSFLRGSGPLTEQLLNFCTSSAQSSGRIPGEPLQARDDHAFTERETAV